MTLTNTSILAAIILGSFTACQPYSKDFSSADLSAIKASSNEWVESYNQNDWQKLATLFSPDATMMPPNSSEVVGRTAIAAWEAKNESGFRIAFDIQQIDGNGNIAYVRGRSCVFIPDGNGGYGVDVGKFLETRKKQADDTWLIVADIFNSDAAIGSELADSCPFAGRP
jgi:uncharacterized protein (TIGR02246 family)